MSFRPHGLATPTVPYRPGRQTWNRQGVAMGMGEGDWNAYGDVLMSRPSTSTDDPVFGEGSMLDTRGPTLQGWARLQYSVFASGVSKSMTVRLKRDGTTIASDTNTSLSDNTTGAAYTIDLAIPPWPVGAHYEWWWEGNTSGANRTQYTASRWIWVPVDGVRVESSVDQSESITVLQAHRTFVTTDLDLIRLRTVGPTRGGTAKLVWSVNAVGCSKVGTVVRLWQDARPFLPPKLLYASTPFNGTEPDSGAGTQQNSGTIAIPPCDHPALYRWAVDCPCIWLGEDTSSPLRRAIWISEGSIIVPPVRNR